MFDHYAKYATRDWFGQPVCRTDNLGQLPRRAATRPLPDGINQPAFDRLATRMAGAR